VPLPRLAQWLCTGPAALAGLSSRKGSLAKGFDADIVIWDPDADFVVDAEYLHHRHKPTPYAGRRLRGRVRATYVRGHLVYRDGNLKGSPAGMLIRRV
jgi:allantoinase